MLRLSNEFPRLFEAKQRRESRTITASTMAYELSLLAGKQINENRCRTFIRHGGEMDRFPADFIASIIVWLNVTPGEFFRIEQEEPQPAAV